MKQIVSVLLLLTMLFSLNCVSYADGVDISKLENNDVCTIDKFSNEWKIVGGYKKEFKDAKVEIYVFLSPKYVENGWGPDLRVYYYDKDNSHYDEVSALRGVVDDKIYKFESFDQMENGEGYTVFGGSVMREFLNHLSSVIELSLQIEHTTKEGTSYQTTIDPVYASELKNIIEAGRLFEEINLWDPNVTTDLTDNDTYYKASIDDNEFYDKNNNDSDEKLYQAMKGAYVNKSYQGCLDYCKKLGDYKDTYQYMVAAMAHNWFDYCETVEDVNSLAQLLIQQIDFEDSKDLLVSNIFFAIPYLKGYWSSSNGGITFEMKDDGGYITTVPVVPRAGDTFDLTDGIMYRYFSNNPSKKTPNLQIIPISETEMQIY